MQTAPAGRAYAYQQARLSHSHAYLEKPLLRAIAPLSNGHDVRALDFGCGSGAFTAWLRDRGFSAMGVDISETGIEVARHAFPEIDFSTDVSLDNLLSLGPFDLVACVEVIAHCYKPEEELRKLWEVLRPEGALVLSTPYHGYLKNLAMAVTGRLQKHLDTGWDGAYVHFFTEASIRALVERSGFVDITLARAGRVPALAKSIVLTARKPGG